MNPIPHPAGILALAALTATPAGADITAWGAAAHAAHAAQLRPKSAPVAGAERAVVKASRSSGCDNGGLGLCYDPGSGKLVYRKTREYMPALPGMSPEHISLRKDRITFKYTFR